MPDFDNCVLQLTDRVTAKRCALRVELRHADWPLGRLLERYLRDCPLPELLAAGRITPQSAENLRDIQDYVYAIADDGSLLDTCAGVAFEQNGRAAPPDAPPAVSMVRVGDADARLIDVTIDRLNVGYDRNWAGFHKRRWQRRADAYAAFVSETLAARYGPARADTISASDTPQDAKRLLRALARRIWDAPFENYSRFAGRMLAYKTGDETVRNIAEGAGGICSETVQALKFLTDKLGLRSQYVLAGANATPPMPEDKLREMLTTFDFRFAKRYMRYWQHVALVNNIGGEEILVDATNGNVPFLFLEGDAAHQLLRDDEDKRHVPVRMAVQTERFYYHRVTQSIVEDLYFAMEGWIEDADLMQVFDNELGLCITPRYFVAPVAYRNGKAFERIRRQYADACEDAGLRFEVGREWTLDTPLGVRFAEAEPDAANAVLAGRERLIERLDECVGAGHDAGLAVVELAPDA